MLAPLLAALASGLAGVLGAAAILLIPDDRRPVIIRGLLGFAVGSLLSVAFLGLIPRAIEAGGKIETVMAAMLAGTIGLFLMEKFVLWRHSHEEEDVQRCPDPAEHGDHTPEEHHSHAHVHHMGPLVLVGDGLHNFVDGVVIAAAFLSSTPLGITTALAVAAHELPHEVSDYAILLEAGYSRGRALLLNILSGLTAVLGAALGYLFLDALEGVIPVVLGLAAATFLYLATTALMPVLHRRSGTRAAGYQVLMVLAGVGTFVGMHHLFH